MWSWISARGGPNTGLKAQQGRVAATAQHLNAPESKDKLTPGSSEPSQAPHSLMGTDAAGLAALHQDNGFPQACCPRSAGLLQAECG